MLYAFEGRSTLVVEWYMTPHPKGASLRLCAGFKAIPFITLLVAVCIHAHPRRPESGPEPGNRSAVAVQSRSQGTIHRRSLSIARQSGVRPGPASPGTPNSTIFATTPVWAGIESRLLLPQPQPSTRELIHFGAVDYLAEVWVNGKRLGEHEGGYTPFTFDLTGKVHAGNNEILVRVFDPPMPPPLPAPLKNSGPPKEVLRPPPPKNKALPPLEQRLDYNEIPHGKQNWYVQTSGLWQPVTLETVPLRYVVWVHVTPHNSGDVTVEARLGGQRKLEASAGHALRSLWWDRRAAGACCGRNRRRRARRT